MTVLPDSSSANLSSTARFPLCRQLRRVGGWRSERDASRQPMPTTVAPDIRRSPRSRGFGSKTGPSPTQTPSGWSRTAAVNRAPPIRARAPDFIGSIRPASGRCPRGAGGPSKRYPSPACRTAFTAPFWFSLTAVSHNSGWMACWLPPEQRKPAITTMPVWRRTPMNTPRPYRPPEWGTVSYRLNMRVA